MYEREKWEPRLLGVQACEGQEPAGGVWELGVKRRRVRLGSWPEVCEDCE